MILSFAHKGVERYYRTGSWAVRVSGNWRLTFRFQGRDVERVNYEDYH